MGISKPTGEYAEQMLNPGGWPDANEDIFYDRAQEFNQVLWKVTDVLETTRYQKGLVFDTGVWLGGAANAASGALGANINQLMTLQDYLATAITWHRHIAGLIAQAKSAIGNNVDGAHRDIIVLENDAEMDADERAAAINELVNSTHVANVSVVSDAAEQVLASKNWKPPNDALKDLLDQKSPPPPDIPTLVVETPGTGPNIPRPTPAPFIPMPVPPVIPSKPGIPVTPTPVRPVTPTPVTPGTPGRPVTPVVPGVPTPGKPVTPVHPVTPGKPVTPVHPVTPGKPTTPVHPVTPGKPVTPVHPVTPGTPVTPGHPVTPTPAPVTPSQPQPVTPAPQPAPVAPPHSAPITPSPAPAPQPAPDAPASPNQPLTPADPGKPSPTTPDVPGHDAPHVKPAAATTTDAPAPGRHVDHQLQPGARVDDTSTGVAPAAAGGVGVPAARSAPAPSMGGGGSKPGGGLSAGPATASGATPRGGVGRAPLGSVKPTAAAPSTEHASTRLAGHVASTHDTRDTEPPDVAAAVSVPVSAARAARDAATAATRRSAKSDPLALARRIAAALNASDSPGLGDFGFFWITAVTTDGKIVVANSYGLAYIPDGVELPKAVHMASADDAVPAEERARSATYPIMAVQGWATHHATKLRAVIGTKEQLANSDPGAAKIVLEPDDIPESGQMVGRSRLEVVDPEAAARLADTSDVRLIDLLPPAPADANPPEDGRTMMWFDLMKFMTSTAGGREVAHLRAFHTYAAHARDIALHQAYNAADAQALRPAVADWLYWQYVAGLLDSAMSDAS
ncbi:secretion protein EspK [Mycobacterium haemophilum DSM 44634]|uniref:secretion protein EspK n=1 Tax=Mycobacterium haemophilum TaxID=29311 RepID=UPI000655D47E|nr:secretion protein EspK [Mycobacterium haemophilum]AKN15722.1 secretion protein EspK [Mycobacterium haemophilum DSM 44634]